MQIELRDSEGTLLISAIMTAITMPADGRLIYTVKQCRYGKHQRVSATPEQQVGCRCRP